MTDDYKLVYGTDYTEPDVQKRVMLMYLMGMVARQDWNGVADAAMDIREMEAEKR